MPNTKSAAKRQKQTVEQTALNKTRKSRVTTARRKMLSSMHMGDASQSEADYRQFCSALDKAAKAGVIKANQADRSKARALKALSKVGKA